MQEIAVGLKKENALGISSEYRELRIHNKVSSGRKYFREMRKFLENAKYFREMRKFCENHEFCCCNI